MRYWMELIIRIHKCIKGHHQPNSMMGNGKYRREVLDELSTKLLLYLTDYSRTEEEQKDKEK